MIGNCRGCQEDKSYAYERQQEGDHVATTPDWPSSYPNNKGHYHILIVNDKGKIVVQ